MISVKDYKQIISCINADFLLLDKCLYEIFGDEKNLFHAQLKSYIFSSSKRIRSALIFLFARAVDAPVNQNRINIAAGVELIHNASLIHDDVIDEASTRRGAPSINSAFDEKMAVIAGDYLLALALQLISKTEPREVLDIFVKALENLCSGEINQYFSRHKITSIDDYVEKSKNKTAELFIAGLSSAFTDFGEFEREQIERFALNFGIAFQIRDDLANFLSGDSGSLNDINNGIYTAPLIYAQEECSDIFSSNDVSILSQKVLKTSAVEKTKCLLKYYTNNALESLSFIEDNQYRQAIVDLCSLVKEI